MQWLHKLIFQLKKIAFIIPMAKPAKSNCRYSSKYRHCKMQLRTNYKFRQPWK